MTQWLLAQPSPESPDIDHYARTHPLCEFVDEGIESGVNENDEGLIVNELYSYAVFPRLEGAD